MKVLLGACLFMYLSSVYAGPYGHGGAHGGTGHWHGGYSGYHNGGYYHGGYQHQYYNNTVITPGFVINSGYPYGYYPYNDVGGYYYTVPDDSSYDDQANQQDVIPDDEDESQSIIDN